MRLDEMQQEAHRNSREKGFWDTPPNLAEKLALIHSEVSEALEELRKPDSPGIGEELADVVIRVMDLAEYLGINLELEIAQKMERNKLRAHKHGKLF